MQQLTPEEATDLAYNTTGAYMIIMQRQYSTIAIRRASAVVC